MRKAVLIALTASVASACACSSPTKADSGGDAGTAGDGGVLLDGGEMSVEGGCWGRDGRKFITELKTGALCYFVSFRRPDAGVQALFPAVVAPDDFFVDDARVGLCVSQMEQADGRLDPQSPQIAGFAADISWHIFLKGVPYAFNANGTLDFSGYRYWFATPPEGAGITDTCRGN